MFEILWILVVCFKIKLDWGKLKKKLSWYSNEKCGFKKWFY